MNDELEKLLAPLADRLPLVLAAGDIWTAQETFDVDGEVDRYQSWLASCGGGPFGALAVAAVNALPELLAMVKRLEEALKPFAAVGGRVSADTNDERHIWPIGGITAGDFRRARAALKETGQ